MTHAPDETTPKILPPPPQDAWGRYYAERGSFGGLLWVRPAELAEVHEQILHLEPRDAVCELSAWMSQPFGGRDFLLSLHHRAFGPPRAFDPGGAWALVARELEDAFASGWLVIHAERPPASVPGTVPVVPGKTPRPPVLPGPNVTWIEIALVDEEGRPIAGEPVEVLTPAGRQLHATTDDQGLVRIDGVVAGVCDVTFPRIDAREWRRR